MEWAEILNIILGGTSVAAVVGFVVYRKQNKRLKDNEVKASDVDTQRQQIELAELYKEKVLELIGQVSEKQDTGNENQHRILEKLDRLEDKVGDIETYLNGPYHQWLANKDKKENDYEETE